MATTSQSGWLPQRDGRATMTPWDMAQGSAGVELFHLC
jgi:hypothetical protein